jgi:hypothetical protein
VSEITRPHEDPTLQSPELREMIWALELSAVPELGPQKIEAIWREVRARASGNAPPELAGIMTQMKESLARGLRVIAATLVQETLIPSPAVRGTETASPKLLVYETEEYAISLTFQTLPESTRLKLIGQVVPKTAPDLGPGGEVAVWSESETSAGPVNPNGEFTLEGVPAGDLHIDILLGTDSIQLSPIHTGAARAKED